MTLTSCNSNESNRLDPECSICKKSTAKIEIVSPNKDPKEIEYWSKEMIESYRKYRDFNSFYFIYSGPGGSNGLGDEIDIERKERLEKIFSKPYNLKAIKKEFYDAAGCCKKCDKFYCKKHWFISSIGVGTCPVDHKQSLDPHW